MFNSLVTIYQVTTLTENMKSNLYSRILYYLSCIGMIPKSLMAMYIAGIVTCLCFCFSVSLYVYYYMVLSFNDYRNPVLMVITDVSFVVVGYLCPFLNFLLVKNNPDFLQKPYIPGKIYVNEG